MFLIVLGAVIAAAIFFWLRSERAMGLNEKVYLRRRGYDAGEKNEPGPPVARDARLFSLIESLKDISPYSRQRAAEELARMCAANQRDPRMLSPLVAALGDNDASVRGSVALALGNLGDPQAIEPLKDRIEVEESIHVRAQVQKALEKLKG